MAKAVTQTLENQKVLIWTNLRCGPRSKKKLSIVVNDCKIEYLERGAGWLNWALLTFNDPFTTKEVSIRRMVNSGFQILNVEEAGYGIRGFEGFIDRPKRKRKEKLKKKALPEGANAVTGIIAGAGLGNVQWGAPLGGLAMTESYYAPKKNMLAARNFELDEIDPPLPIRAKLVDAKERILREDKDNFMKEYKYDYKAPVAFDNYWLAEPAKTTTVQKISDSIMEVTKQYLGTRLVSDVEVTQDKFDPSIVNVKAMVLPEPRPLNNIDFTFTIENGIVEHEDAKI